MFSHILFAKLVFLLGILRVQSSGFFWHISDTHVDQNYSRTGNPSNLCHTDRSRSFPDNGLYGNFLCDSPEYLVNVTLMSMKQIQPHPDFIIWTGDNLPHTRVLKAEYNVIFQAIKNTTQVMTSLFPGIPIFPCIGNHDTFPPNILPTSDSSLNIYKGFLEEGGWGQILPRETWPDFLKGGYFSSLINSNLRLISLNTILWYTPNTISLEIPDPADQFKWLGEVLQNCSQLLQKVYIIGHVSPGFYNRGVPGQKSDPTFHLHHLETYLQLMNEFSDIIVGQFYGHIHMDYFQVYQYNTGTFKGSSLLASSVTPWYYVNKFNTSLPVNPSVRLMHYSPLNATLLDYEQFYLNLTSANSIGGIDENGMLYQKLYTFTEFYGVQDLSTQSLVQVFEQLKRNQTLFDQFFVYATAGKQYTVCDSVCKVAQLCAMSCISSKEYDLCMNNVGQMNPFKAEFPQHMQHVNSILIYGSAILVVVIISLVIFISRKKSYESRVRDPEKIAFSSWPFCVNKAQTM